MALLECPLLAEVFPAIPSSQVGLSVFCENEYAAMATLKGQYE